MTDVITGKPDLQAQYEAQRHVFVPDAYDPDMGSFIVRDLDTIFRYTRMPITSHNERQASQTNQGRYDQYPYLRSVLSDLGSCALELTGEELWPVMPPDQVRLTYIDMQADGVGNAHIDSPDLVGPVAITTPKGVSGLRIYNANGNYEDYEISPGNAVLLDAESLLVHQAWAIGGARVGLGVARATKTKRSA